MIVFGSTCTSKTHSLYLFTELFEHMKDVISSFYNNFESLENIENLSYVLGSELWESKFDGVLSLVKKYIVDIWEIRKHKLYDSDSGPGQQLHSWSSPGERNDKFSCNGKFGQNGMFA